MEFKFNSTADDMAFRDRVINNEPSAVNYFLKKYSWPFLNYIGREIMHENPCRVYDFDSQCYKDDYAMGLLGEYYFFIAAKIVPPPQWDKLRMYKGFCGLYTYINVITTRHFLKLKAGESKVPSNPGDDDSGEINNNGGSKNEIEIGTNDIFFENGDAEKETKELAMRALDDLKTRVSTSKGKKIDGEKDYWVLFYSINGYDNYTIAEELEGYLPRPLMEMERLDVQTRVAQWKLRAIYHLVDLILDKKNEKKYSELRSQIIRH